MKNNSTCEPHLNDPFSFCYVVFPLKYEQAQNPFSKCLVEVHNKATCPKINDKSCRVLR